MAYRWVIEGATVSTGKSKDRSASIFFDFKTEIDEFDAAVTTMLRESQREIVKQYLSEENVERFSHGRTWTHRANDEIEPGKMQTLSSEWEIQFDDLIQGDLSLIPRKVAEVIDDMGRQFMEMMYATISDSTERSGNVVDGRVTGSIPATFLEALRKIELAVGRDGQVRMPTIHVPSTMGSRIISELEAQPSEFREEVDRAVRRTYSNERFTASRVVADVPQVETVPISVFD